MEQTKNERSIVLTRHTYYQIIHDLWRALPPPVSDDPEDRICRDNAAIATVASLLPADPAEAALAGQFVAACAHAMDCLRLVDAHRADLPIAMKCRAQAASMIRQACMARSALLRIQQARRKCEESRTNDPAWSDHGILDRMAEALRRARVPGPTADAAETTVPGPMEPGFSIQDAHPQAASPRRDAVTEEPVSTQSVSFYETKSQNRANETLARPRSPASPLRETTDSLPGLPAPRRPPHHPNEWLEAISGYLPAGSASSRRQLLASAAVTAAMNLTPRPAITMSRASAA